MTRSLYGRLRRRFGPRISGRERRDLVQRRLRDFKTEFEPQTRLARRGALRAGRSAVVVIGAGFGGLMAGATLSFDFEVTVLEARDRVGGRVHTLQYADGRLIEAGAELIGYNHPTWLSLAETFELGLSVLTSEDDFAAMGLELPMWLDGRLLTPAELEVVYEEMTAAFDDMGYQAESIDAYSPWLSRNAEALDKRPLSDWIADLPCSDLTKAAIEAQFANNNGAASARQSWLGNLALVAGGAMAGQPAAFFDLSETVRCEGGNQSLARRLAELIEANGGRVLTSMPVDKIILDAGVSVVCRNGETYGGDAAVLATPPTVWPAVAPEPIPDAYRMSMGIVLKYLSSTPSRFWIPSALAPSSTSEAFGMTWEGTDNQIGREPEFSLFAGGAAAQAALDAYQRGGDAGVHAFYDSNIDGIYSGYSAAREQWPRFVPWPLEEWTRTGYACPAPGEVTRYGPLIDAAFRDRLWFAGEHTCLAFYGYMEGALQSGWRTADKILGR